MLSTVLQKRNHKKKKMLINVNVLQYLWHLETGKQIYKQHPFQTSLGGQIAFPDLFILRIMTKCKQRILRDKH